MELSKLVARDASGNAHTILKTTAGQISDSSLGFRVQHGVATYSLAECGTTLRLNSETGMLETVDGKSVFTLESTEHQ